MKRLACPHAVQGVELLGDKGSKRVSADEALAGKTLGLYFSAHWCPPCKAFTPLLARVYKTLREKNSDFEVVFVSGDKSEAQAEVRRARVRKPSHRPCSCCRQQL